VLARPLLGISLLLFVALAGCAGGKAPVAETAEPSSVLDAGDEASGGDLVGNVVDDQIQPLSNVDVALIDTEFAVKTDAAGAFEFRNLPAGSHKIAAQRLGYSSVLRSVDIVAGETLELTLTLTATAIKEPWADVQGPFAGFSNCEFGTAALTGPCLGVNAIYGAQPNEKGQFPFKMHDETTSLVAEMRWSQSTAATAQSNGLQFSYQGRSTSHYWCWGAGNSPVKIQYNWEDNECISSGAHPKQQAAASAPTEKQTLFVRLSHPFRPVGSTSDPAPVIVTVQQKFEMVYTLFQNQLPPEDYSALTDG
jgi:hypothetical protein